MSKFAIIKVGPFQYNVEEGKEYSVPKFSAEVGKTLTVSDVLAVGDEKSITLGKPNVDKASVELEILDIVKGEKIRTAVYKAKSRYRRVRGFRKQLVKFKVTKINS